MIIRLKKQLPTSKQEFPASFPNIIKQEGAGDKSTPLVAAVDLGAEAEEDAAEVAESVEEEAVEVAVEVAMAMVSVNLKMVLTLLTLLVSSMMMNGTSCPMRRGIRYMHAQREQKPLRSERTSGERQVRQVPHPSQARR